MESTDNILTPRQKDGGVLHFSVHRANGSIERHRATNYFNGLYPDIGSGSMRQNTSGSAYYRMLLYGNSAVKTLTGTWAQSGNIISRVSGTDVIPTNQLCFRFADGTFGGFHVSGSGTSANVSRSQTVPAQALSYYGDWYSSGAYPVLYETVNYFAAVKTYSGGVITNTITGPHLTSMVTATTTIRTIGIQYIGGGSYERAGSIFALSTPLVLNPGDVVSLDSYVATLTFEGLGAPIPFSSGNSPIPGFTGSGSYQNLIPHTGANTYQVAGNRIWLINAANIYTVPNTPQIIQVNPSVLTPYETITSVVNARGSMQNSNDRTEYNSLYGLTTMSSTTLRQIAWGETNRIFGIITYDTDQTIDVDTNLYVMSRLRWKPDLEPPPI